MPSGALHVRPANAGTSELRVRQSIRPDAANVPRGDGVERLFETTFALAQQDEVLGIGVIADPLQPAGTLGELLLPRTYLPCLPHGAQRGLMGPRGARAAARLRSASGAGAAGARRAGRAGPARPGRLSASAPGLSPGAAG